MHVIKIENRGPEGVRGYKQFRLTEAGGNELHKRMVANVPFAELLTGIELDGAEPVGELVRGTNEIPGFEDVPAKPARQAKTAPGK